ncbi:MAG TPA: (d)CMP kinase [Actinomycetota bacterium]
MPEVDPGGMLCVVMPTVIAIDGPAGSGKSTLARRLASELGLAYVNTGLMYRALAAAALRAGIGLDDEDALAGAARALTFGLDDGRPRQLLVGGRQPGPELASAEVEAVVSRVSRHPAVRAVLRAQQRALGAGGAVVEGRDIGTAVFPDAPLKIFLAATTVARTGRRAAERGARDDAVARDLERRDRLDDRTNPLRPAPGAHVLDSTALSRDQVANAALALARGAGIAARRAT